MFSKQKILHSLGIGVAVLLLAGAGLAQQKTTTVVREKPAVNNSERAEQLYNEGVAAANRKQWDKAEQKFEEAFALDPNPQIAANLGNAELAAGKACDAIEHFEYFFDKDKDAGRDGRAEIKSLFDQAVSRVVLVKLVVNQDGADVFVDGQSIGKSRQDHRICLKSGPHTFVVTKDGWEPASHFEILPQGLSTEVKLEMKVAKGAKVLPSGTNETSSTAARAWRAPLKYTSIGVGLLGIAAGIGFTGAAFKQDTKLATQTSVGLQIQQQTNRAYCPRGFPLDSNCIRINDTLVLRNRFTETAVVGYTAAAIGAAGMITWLLTRPKDMQSNLRVGTAITLSELLIFGAF